jgi:hypothetical protein
VYVDRWFSIPKIFYHSWGFKAKAVGTLMSNRKKKPKQAFSGKLKNGEAYHANRITSWPFSGRASVMYFS